MPIRHGIITVFRIRPDFPAFFLLIAVLVVSAALAAIGEVDVLHGEGKLPGLVPDLLISPLSGQLIEAAHIP